MARVAETSSIEHLGKIKISTSIEVYGNNATLANFQTVGCKCIETANTNRDAEN